ncbi:hypothetical protein BSKO_03800 [Bryopsis sp. KO-2023]|nr:hypothetical protein BSKO_03800 [Bryopsis sp. KO-2023]
MARRRAAPARRPAAKPATPSRSYGTTAQPAKTAPPPAPAASAPPPAQQQGGGMLSGLAGTMMQGAALGAGSELAHRAVGSFFSGGGESAPAEQPQQQQPVQSVAPGEVCANQAKAFTDCMTANNGEMGACQFYFDTLQQCKMHGM